MIECIPPRLSTCFPQGSTWWLGCGRLILWVNARNPLAGLTRPATGHEIDQPLSKEIEWRTSSRVVEPVGDDEQIRPVRYHVLVETLVGSRFSAVLVGGATG